MATIPYQTVVKGIEEANVTFMEKKEIKKILFFSYEVTRWVEVAREQLGNDIYIITDRPIRNVYINGEKFKNILIMDN